MTPEEHPKHTYLLFTHIDENGHACLEDEYGIIIDLPLAWLPNNASPGTIFATSNVASDDISSLFFEIDLENAHTAWRRRKAEGERLP